MSRRPTSTASGVARIGVAVWTGSLTGYALLAIVGRALEPAEFGLFVAFWGVLFGAGAALSTVEQETARHAAGEAERDQGPPVPAVVTAAAVIAALAAALTLLPPAAERLYGDPDSPLGLLVVAAALGFAVQFGVRGSMIGSGAVGPYSWLVFAEALVRLVVLLATLALIGLDLVSSAIAVTTGAFAWLAWAGRVRHLVPRQRLSPATWVAATGRAASLMAAAALTGAMISAYPALVTALTDGAPGAAGGAVFAAVTVSRVPLLLLSPVQALAVPFVVRARERPDGSSALRRGVLLGSALFLLAGALAGAAAWLAGPWAVRLFYGDAYDVPAPAIALLVFSACLLAWVQLLSAAFIALAAHRRMLAMWVVAVTATVVWLVVSPLDVIGTTSVGAAVGPVAALGYGIPVLWRLAGRSRTER